MSFMTSRMRCSITMPFLRYANGAVQFVRGNTVPAISEHPCCNHPLIQLDSRILIDRSDFEGELLLTTLAIPDEPRLDEPVVIRSAARARNLTFRPTKPGHILKAAFWIAEEDYGVLECRTAFPWVNFTKKVNMC